MKSEPSPDIPSPEPRIDTNTDSDHVYSRARERLQKLKSPANPLLANDEMQRLQREVQIYQLALEMQTEELRLSQSAHNEDRAQALAAVNYYKNLYEFCPVAYFTVDNTGIIIHANNVGTKLLGFENARRASVSPTAINIREFIPQSDLHLFNHFFSQLINSGVGEQSQASEQLCELKLKPLSQPANDNPFEHIVQVSGAITGVRQEFLIVMSDITKCRQSENELREIEARWHYAIEGAGDGVWDWDVENGKLMFSARMKAMHGYADGEIGNDFGDWSSRIHPDDIPYAMGVLYRHFNGETKSYTNEYRFRDKDGAYKWVVDRGLVVSRDPANKPLRMVGMHTDITARRKVEEDLRTSARLLEASQAIAKVGSVEMNLKNNSLFWTAETYRIHDTSPQEFDPSLNLSLEYYLPGSREKITAALKLACETGEVFDLELEKLTMKGRRIDLRTTCTATFQDGKPVRLTGIFQDITERKQAERRQQHHNRILEMLTAKAPLSDVLDAITRDVEMLNPAMHCTILLMDEDGIHLRHGAAPSLPEFYVKAIDGSPIGPTAGSCGAAAFTAQRVLVNDIDTHPWWDDYRELAQKAGLRACWSEPIFSSQGRVLGTFAIYHNKACSPTLADLDLIASESRLAALAIERTCEENRLQLAARVFSHAREGILITDAAGTIVDVNATFSQITGYSREEALGQNPRILQSGRHGADFYADMWNELLVNGYWSGEVWNKRKNGDIYAEMATISAVMDSSGKPQNFVNLFTDITQLKEHQNQLEYIAHYDSLTNLPNRMLLADRLKQAITRSHRGGWSLAVLYLDLDGFKSINDHHGHDVGDQLLVTVANRLKGALREGDTLARIGGDEFIVVLVDLELPQDYEPILARLLEAASETVMVDELMLRVSASIGVTIYPQDGVDADQLMRHADQAMYIAKQAGKNCFHLFDVARDAAVQTHRESIEHIRLALERAEFVLYYQPKVNMKTGAIIGVEALIRWRHPELGLLLPINFLPVMENHPISIEVGEWVIDSALTQIADWRNAGLEISVSVNISALQLQHRDFPKRLAELLTVHSDIKPYSLELEILETSALEDITEVAELMRACRELGVRFAVDDFGTGYSSLTYLKRLPARLLKIDQSFVRDMLDDPDDLAIVKGVIGLATAFHREVIAEGVETIAHGAMLLSLGCELAQGYGIARPMPAEDLLSWYASWRPDPAWTVWNSDIDV